jgi:hypothetical protein
MKINKSFFILFLFAWSIGVIAINYYSWIWLADLSFIALLFIYVVRAECSVNRALDKQIKNTGIKNEKEKRIYR